MSEVQVLVAVVPQRPKHRAIPVRLRPIGASEHECRTRGNRPLKLEPRGSLQMGTCPLGQAAGCTGDQRVIRIGRIRSRHRSQGRHVTLEVDGDESPEIRSVFDVSEKL